MFLHVYEAVGWLTQAPGKGWWLMMKIRSMLVLLKRSTVWVLWAALLLPVIWGFIPPGPSLVDLH